MPIFTNDEIRLLRASRNMKQSEVAKKMDISPQRYSDLENQSDLKQGSINRILKVLGYTMESARRYLDNIPPPEID